MKRAIIITIIVAAFGWVIYDYVQSSSENSAIKSEEEAKEPDVDQVGDVTVGIEKGNMAPDFELETLDGEKVKLSDFKGEQILLNFWATWCPPCRAEMPDMQRFHEDTDAVVLAVNMVLSEPNRENIPEFLEEFGITFRVPLDENSDVSELYGDVTALPTSFLIDSDGMIHNMAVGPLNYEMMVQEFAKMK